MTKDEDEGYDVVTPQQVSDVTTKIDEVLAQFKELTPHHHVMILSIMIVCTAKSCNVGKEDLIDEFENLVYEYYDQVELRLQS